MSAIGDRMRELRGPSSLREMADPVGIKFQAWARYEAGGATPGGEIITKICRVHACSADWLLGLTDKSCPRGNISVRAAPGSMAINVSHNKIGDAVGPISIKGDTPPSCRTCPHLKKLKALEKVLGR